MGESNILGDALAGIVRQAVEEAIRSNKVAVEQRLMSMDTAAKYLDMSEDSLRHKVRNGDVPYVRVDGVNRFDRFELDRWIARNTVREKI